MRPCVFVSASIAVVGLVGWPALAFCEVAADKEKVKAAVASSEPEDKRKIETKLRDIVDPVRIDNASARDAFKWWANTTGISLVIDWRQMEEDGLDPEKKINIDLHNIPAGKVLAMLMKQSSPDTALLYEITPWYIQITTKSRADRELVTRFYDITDMVHERPPMRAAPKFDLSSALSSGGGGGKGGGGGGGGGSSIFTSSEDSGKGRGEAGKSAEAQKLIDTITGSIEPEIWESKGGPATITYLRGFLVVKAPVYVQAQIGLPTRDDTPRPVVGFGGGADPSDKPAAGVAGVSSTTTKVGGVAK